MDKEFIQELVNRKFKPSRTNSDFFFKKKGEFMLTVYVGSKVAVYISLIKNATPLTEVVRDGDETLRQMVNRAWDNVYMAIA